VDEDLGDRGRVFDRRQKAQPAATGATGQNIKGKDPAHQVGPRLRPARGRSAALGGAIVVATGGKAEGDAVRGGAGVAEVVTGPHPEEVGLGEAGAATAPRSDDADGRQRARGVSTPWYTTKLMWGLGVMAAKRSRNSWGGEDQVAGAVMPRAPERAEDAAVGEPRETFLRQRRAQEIAAKSLERGPIVGAHRALGVQIEAREMRVAAADREHPRGIVVDIRLGARQVTPGCVQRRSRRGGGGLVRSE
jgi:hypothetical protein